MNRVKVFLSRWQVLGAQDIGDDPYLDRLRLLVTPLFTVYLHHIHRDDGDRAPHNHPWWFGSLVLTGGYTEIFYPDTRDMSHYWSRNHKRWSFHGFRRLAAHKIVRIDKPLWTLVVTGPPLNHKWGFYPGGEFVPWQDYEDRENIVAGWPVWKKEGKLR